jgi:hypothetical protein
MLGIRRIIVVELLGVEECLVYSFSRDGEIHFLMDSVGGVRNFFVVVLGSGEGDARETDAGSDLQ